MIRRNRLLIAFDFDHTIVEENSDIVARKLIHPDLIPEEVRKLYQAKGWTEYMSEIFKHLHKHKVSRDRILEAMRELRPTQQMPQLLRWLKEHGHEAIIISDSNSIFIDEWLRHLRLHECVQRVFTNPASFDENGVLLLQPYMDQEFCPLSTRNLCKGYILESYIKERLEEGVTFDTIAYVGDGQNDFCPSLKLKCKDLVFARAGFPLEKRINDPNEERKVVADVLSWDSADKIIEVLQNTLTDKINLK